MATHFPTSHDGLNRTMLGASIAKSFFFDIFSAKQVPTYVLGITIMAVVTMTERALEATQSSFALEWAILTVVALLTFGLLARVVIRATRATQRGFARYAEKARKTRADVNLWATARQDPRVMNEILAAQDRGDWLIDESRSQSARGTVKDDGLAALAPWAQLTRYY